MDLLQLDFRKNQKTQKKFKNLIIFDGEFYAGLHFVDTNQDVFNNNGEKK